MNKIKTGDQVIVLTGKDKGKTGEVLQILENDRVLVNDVNLVKKHTKANPASGVAGGILTKEASIHISNIAILNPSSKKADKVKIKQENEEKIRMFKSDDKPVDA